MAKKTDPPPPEADDAVDPAAAADGDAPKDPSHDGDDEPKGRFARLTRRILEREDGRNVLSAMWETSDRARTEMVRLVAREVRTYLDALELKEDLLDLVRSHSLEVHASFRLKPLADAVDRAPRSEGRPAPKKGEAPKDGAHGESRDDDAEGDGDDGSR